MKIILAIAAAALLSVAPSSAAPNANPNVTITFAKLTGQNGDPFSVYQESGFEIGAAPGASWLIGLEGGHPPPYVYFNAPPSAHVRNRLVVWHGGLTFNFASVDLYSSITPIPYVFRGLRKGVSAFTVRGTVPNTFGAFATISNPRSNVTIDTLELILTDVTNACCSNPMGLDNIALTHVAHR